MTDMTLDVVQGAAPQAGGAPGPVTLPPLREDLKLLPGAASADGSPTWTLYDPARHRFIRIGWLEFEILSRWGLRTSVAVAQSITAETTIRAKEDDVLDFLRFAYLAGLVLPMGENAIARLMSEAAGRKLSTSSWLLKNYLFLRIRLLNPDRLLGRMFAAIEWALTPTFLVILAALAALALYLISRQWATYTHSFLHMFSLEGALLVGAALGTAKVVHEFGHGLMSKRFGCRVPAMGVALLVLLPVLWTDTTDAWRLTDRRKRFLIDAAGMLAETTLAVFASLAWCVLPDGPLRTGMFLLSSSTWILTIVVNLNPLMRFDGYFLLSDWLDVPNLQERGFAIGRWWIRERLFGLGVSPPEHFAPRKQRILIAYSIAAMIYRFSLFMGIALVVYHMAFKALGFFLMAVEIWWFIARPVLREFSIWRQSLKGRAINRRTAITFGVAGLILLLIVIPWRRDLTAPALWRAEHQTILYVGEPGQLTKLSQNGDTVEKGDPIFILEAPTVAFHRASAVANLAGLQARMKGVAFDPEEASSTEVGYRELQQAIATLAQVDAQQAELTVRAPFSGIVTDVPLTLRLGESLPRREALGVLLDPATQIVEAYIAEPDLGRVHPGAAATFYPENGDPPIALTVTSVGTAPVRNLDTVELASIYGGGVAVRKDTAGKLIPEAAIYHAVLTPRQGVGRIATRLRGDVAITADRASVLSRIYHRTLAIIVREANL
jgi:putative peptide zinc metalloprotease protein